MTNSQTDLEKFILWFIQIKDIPQQSKLNFINHLIEVGTIDEKSIEFIDEILTYLTKKHQEQANELKRKFEILQSAVDGEKIPEISLKERIVNEAGEDMMKLAIDFKEDYRAYEKQKADKIEAGEIKEEQSEIAKLKQKL